MGMKKIGAFVGIFLVGLLMFGLVSGAGYNIVVPTADPPADPSSSGGGGGGGGATANVTANETTDGVVVSDDAVSGDEDGKKDVVEKGKEIIESVVETAKDLWVWFSVAVVLVIGVLVVYFKKVRKS